MKGETVHGQNFRIDIATTPEEFPFGARGERPFRFTVYERSLVQHLAELDMAGVIQKGSRFDCAYDAVETVARELGEPEVPMAALMARSTCAIPIPGLDDYNKLPLKTLRRAYQAESARFLFRRSSGILGEIPRAGKCLIFFIVHVLAKAKTIILCRALGKYVWAEEAAKWVGEEAVLLFGRAGTDARIFCSKCMGAGSTEVGERDEYGDKTKLRCAHCEGKGEKKVQVHDLELVTEGRVWSEDTGKLKKDGTPRLQRRVARFTPLPAVWRCPVHEDESDSRPRECRQCRVRMTELLGRARVIIVNYDIISAEVSKGDRGGLDIREDLPGWGPQLAKYRFDMAGCDESHHLRGYDNKTKKGLPSQRERCNEVCAYIPRVYNITGTPTFGFTRDFWGQLDLMTAGLFS